MTQPALAAATATKQGSAWSLHSSSPGQRSHEQRTGEQTQTTTNSTGKRRREEDHTHCLKLSRSLLRGKRTTSGFKIAANFLSDFFSLVSVCFRSSLGVIMGNCLKSPTADDVSLLREGTNNSSSSSVEQLQEHAPPYVVQQVGNPSKNQS